MQVTHMHYTFYSPTMKDEIYITQTICAHGITINKRIGLCTDKFGSILYKYSYTIIYMAMVEAQIYYPRHVSIYGRT